MVFIYSTILRYLAQIIKGNKRLCYKEVISYSITKKLHIYGMNTKRRSKVSTNLNQLARHFNSGGADTEQIRAKILDELADLTAFRLSAEKVLGELYGNAQAYRL